MQAISVLLLTEAAHALFATRYWDCCKPHCSWTANTYGVNPMPSCTAANATIADTMTQSACSSATATNAYTCFNNVPVAVDANNAIGFAAVPVTSTNPPSDVCGKCYKLTFTGAGQYGSNPGATALAGKSMIVQASNIGYDVSHDQFDLQIPGGGVGAFDACSSQWGATDLGAQYGGFLTQCQNGGSPPLDQLKTCVRNKCNTIFAGRPTFAPLLAGCLWFVDWFQCADNPVVTSVEVTCPTALLAISGMNRNPTNPTTPAPTTPTSPTSSTTPTSSTSAPTACVAGNCVCSWATSATCATNDGTPCNIACCCPFRLCSNGVKDAGELGVDCGGSCATACPPTAGDASSAAALSPFFLPLALCFAAWMGL